MRRIREYTEFGLWARGILVEINMTQAELAEAVGVGKSTITDIFTGRTKNNKLLRDCITGYLKGKISADGWDDAAVRKERAGLQKEDRQILKQLSKKA